MHAQNSKNAVVQEGATPVVVGQAVTDVSNIGNANGRVVEGVPYRVNPADAKVELIPSMFKLPEKRQNRKLNEIRKGGELAQRLEKFPAERPWRDVFWILPFCVLLLAGIATCLRYVSSDILQAKSSDDPTSGEAENDEDYPTVAEVVLMGIVGGIVSLVIAAWYLQLAKSYPACVVWCSLLFGPACCILAGIIVFIVAVTSGIVVLYCFAFLSVAGGVCYLGCIFCCWKDLIPFMIKLVEVVAGVIKDNPMMLAVSLLGSVLGVAWAFIMCFAFYGVLTEFEEQRRNSPRGVTYAIYFVIMFVFCWGFLVASNISHVTYSGVFGRWFLCTRDEKPLQTSLKLALTKSLGSICFGSCLIAFVRALEFTVRQMRKDAWESGNVACCIIILVIECVISCIGDLMEYFSEWAYVQVAVRGCSFMDSVRLTFTFCTCANIEYLLRDLLLNSVVSLGALLCAAAGASSGAAIGYAMGSGKKAAFGVIIGWLSGLIAGGTAVNIISSGVKTILVLWAEDPSDLQRSHPEIHAEFEERIVGNIGGGE